MAWHYAPESVALSLASNWRPTVLPFVRSSPIRTARLFSKNVSEFRSGTTSSASTEDHGTELWILCLRAIRANPSHPQANVSVPPMPDTSGRQSLELFPSPNPCSCFSKTRTGKPSRTQCQTSTHLGIVRRKPRSGPPKWVQDILGDGSSYLATVTTKGNYNRKGASPTSGDGLATQVGGPLNPEWLEWFMGFPIGWTESGPLETRSYQQWRRSHS